MPLSDSGPLHRLERPPRYHSLIHPRPALGRGSFLSHFRGVDQPQRGPFVSCLDPPSRSPGFTGMLGETQLDCKHCGGGEGLGGRHCGRQRRIASNAQRADATDRSILQACSTFGHRSPTRLVSKCCRLGDPGHQWCFGRDRISADRKSISPRPSTQGAESTRGHSGRSRPRHVRATIAAFTTILLCTTSGSHPHVCAPDGIPPFSRPLRSLFDGLIICRPNDHVPPSTPRTQNHIDNRGRATDGFHAFGNLVDLFRTQSHVQDRARPRRHLVSLMADNMVHHGCGPTLDRLHHRSASRFCSVHHGSHSITLRLVVLRPVRATDHPRIHPTRLSGLFLGRRNVATEPV